MTFREALRSPNAGVRLAACNFLCRFRDVQSIGAIGRLLPGFDSAQRAMLIANLPRMESREVVDLLLDQLDERLDSGPHPMWAYNVSVDAAKALRTLTGIEFPLDTAQAWRRWDKLKALPAEVLLRKATQGGFRDPQAGREHYVGPDGCTLRGQLCRTRVDRGPSV